MSRRLSVLLALVLAGACVGCDSLFLHTQFVLLRETSERVWLGREREDDLRAVSPVLQAAVEEADRFYSRTLLIRDAPQCPAYFPAAGLTWNVFGLLLLVNPDHLGGMADWRGRTFAVVRESDYPSGLEVVVIHEMSHVYISSDACPRPIEEGIVIAVSMLTHPSCLGLYRSRAAGLLQECSQDDLQHLTQQLRTGQTGLLLWGEKARQLEAAAFSLVDFVNREDGLVGVRGMLERLHGGSASAWEAAAFALAVSEEELGERWRSYLRQKYLDPCDPHLWSPLGKEQTEERPTRADGKKEGRLAVPFRDLANQAVIELLTLAACQQLVAPEEECRRLLWAAPLNPAVYPLAAKVHHDSGRADSAREVWRTGWRLAGSPGDRAGRFLSRSFYEEEARHAARVHAPDLKEDVRALCRKLAPLWCLIADCPTLAEALATSGEAAHTREAFEARIRAAVIAGATGAAEELAEETVERFPEKVQFRYYLAWLLYEREDVAGAVELLLDDEHWPKESPWSDLRFRLLTRFTESDRGGSAGTLPTATTAQ